MVLSAYNEAEDLASLLMMNSEGGPESFTFFVAF